MVCFDLLISTTAQHAAGQMLNKRRDGIGWGFLVWGDLGQVGWKWEKLSWELILTPSLRLRAAGRAGTFDLLHISQLRSNDGHYLSRTWP